MLEVMKCIGNIAGQGKIDSDVWIIPLEHDATIFGGFPIDGEFVEGSQCVNEVLGMFLSNVGYSKIIDHEGEQDGSVLVAPEAGGMFNGVVPKGGKAFDKL